MKRFLALALLLCLSFTLVACGGGDKEKDYTLSIGVSLTENSSTLKYTNTVAGVVVDGDGKIVLCRIDALDCQFTVDGREFNLPSALQSKDDKGDNYGMTGIADKGEWYKQARHFETFVVGKTLADVQSITGEETDLTAGCTIGVDEFVEAIENALKSEHKKAFKATGDLTGGVSVITKASSASNVVTVASDFAMTVIAGGKIAASIIDSNEVKVSFSGENEDYVYAHKEYKGTKLEQGDNYGMAAYAEQGEWYVQAQKFADTSVGKNVSDLAALDTENVAGCTMGVDGYKAALEKAGTKVR